MKKIVIKKIHACNKMNFSSNINEVIRAVLNSRTDQKHQKHQKYQKYQKRKKHKNATKQKYKTQISEQK